MDVSGTILGVWMCYSTHQRETLYNRVTNINAYLWNAHHFEETTTMRNLSQSLHIVYRIGCCTEKWRDLTFIPVCRRRQIRVRLVCFQIEISRKKAYKYLRTYSWIILCSRKSESERKKLAIKMFSNCVVKFLISSSNINTGRKTTVNPSRYDML